MYAMHVMEEYSTKNMYRCATEEYSTGKESRCAVIPVPEM